MTSPYFWVAATGQVASLAFIVWTTRRQRKRRIAPRD